MFTPTWFRGFSATIDYYDIKIKGAIASLSIASIVNGCVDSATLANQFCAAVTRDVSGNIQNVNNQVFNVAQFKTKGVDFGASYRFNLQDLPYMGDWGGMTLNFNATNVHTLLYNPVAGDQTTRQQGAGALNYDQPRIKFEGRATYEFRNVAFSYAASYIGPMNISNQDRPLDLGYERVPEFVRQDIRLQYTYRGQSLYFGINNIADAEPPYIPGVFTGTGVGSIYGPVGRYFYVGASGKF